MKKQIMVKSLERIIHIARDETRDSRADGPMPWGGAEIRKRKNRDLSTFKPTHGRNMRGRK